MPYIFKIKCIFNIFNFLQYFNFHYFNVPFFFSKINVEADSVVYISCTSNTVVLYHKDIASEGFT